MLPAGACTEFRPLKTQSISGLARASGTSKAAHTQRRTPSLTSQPPRPGGRSPWASPPAAPSSGPWVWPWPAGARPPAQRPRRPVQSREPGSVLGRAGWARHGRRRRRRRRQRNHRVRLSRTNPPHAHTRTVCLSQTIKHSPSLPSSPRRPPWPWPCESCRRWRQQTPLPRRRHEPPPFPSWPASPRAWPPAGWGPREGRALDPRAWAAATAVNQARWAGGFRGLPEALGHRNSPSWQPSPR